MALCEFDVLATLVRSDKERLIKRVERMVKWTEGGCLEWQGSPNPVNGYCKMNVWHRGQHGYVYAHRLFWVLANFKPVPPGHEIDHLCHNVKCVNPAHLEAVIKAENLRRRRGR